MTADPENIEALALLMRVFEELLVRQGTPNERPQDAAILADIRRALPFATAAILQGGRA